MYIQLALDTGNDSNEPTGKLAFLELIRVKLGTAYWEQTICTTVVSQLARLLEVQFVLAERLRHGASCWLFDLPQASLVLSTDFTL